MEEEEGEEEEEEEEEEEGEEGYEFTYPRPEVVSQRTYQ